MVRDGDLNTFVGNPETRLMRAAFWMIRSASSLVETRARYEISKLERGLVVLEIIVGIAPLMGLVGTIFGLILLFGAMDQGAAADTSKFSAGISTALYATLIGLLIAIPALIAWSYYSRKVESFAVRMEAICDEFLRKNYHGSYTSPSSADWRKDTINLTSYAGQSVIVDFRNVGHYGNDLFVDNINISGIALTCAIPSNLTTTNITNSSAQLNWTTTTADSFLIRYTIHGTTNTVWKKISGQPNVTSNTLTGLAANTTYDWLVRSLCNGSAGSVYQSSPATFTTTNSNQACTTPFSLNTTNITNNSAVLNWTSLVTADTFMVRYWKSGTTNYVWKQISGAGGAHSVQLTGLASATTYNWIVRSICTGVAATPYSFTASFSTVAMRNTNSAEENFISKLIVFPNPSVGKVSVAFNSVIRSKGMLVVNDFTGREIFTEAIEINSGENKTDIDLSENSKGLYLLHLQCEGINEIRRITLE